MYVNRLVSSKLKVSVLGKTNNKLDSVMNKVQQRYFSKQI